MNNAAVFLLAWCAFWGGLLVGRWVAYWRWSLSGRHPELALPEYKGRRYRVTMIP